MSCDRAAYVQQLLSGWHAECAIATSPAERRAAEFATFISDNRDKECAFSAKLSCWNGGNDNFLAECGVPGGYFLSIHVLTRAGLGRLLIEGSPIIASSMIGPSGSMYDYRESRPTRVDKQRSFNGKSRSIEMAVESHGASFVRETRTFVIDEHYYFPGMLQNLILPAFDVRWGDSDCRRLVDAFRWKMIDRLRYEQREHPNELLRLSLAHTRSEVFAPHVVRSVDQSTVLG